MKKSFYPKMRGRRENEAVEGKDRAKETFARVSIQRG